MAEENLKNKDDSFWHGKLSPEAYRVMREQGTEPAFSGEHWNNKNKGMYHCAACGVPLFSSEAKFDSGTGWPSFTAPHLGENIGQSEDSRLFARRREVHCERCGGHLGHVFDDGPKKMPDGAPASGKRFCINSCALEFEEGEKREKAS